MPLKLKARPKQKGSGSSAPKAPELTIEDARKTFELGSIERAVAECRNLNDYREQARELNNATNRAKTQAGKAFSSLVLNETIQRGDKIVVGAAAYSFDYATSDVVPAEEFVALFEQGKITREIFLKCISVPKDMATKLVGAHVLDDLVKAKVGNKADIRVEKLDHEIQEPYKIIKKPPPPSKAKKAQNEPVRANIVGTSRRPSLRKLRLR